MNGLRPGGRFTFNSGERVTIINTSRFARSVIAMVLTLSFGGAARAGYTVSTSTEFIYANSSFHGSAQGSDVSAGSIYTGATGSGSQYDSSFANASMRYTVLSRAVQDYGIFHGWTYVDAWRLEPGNTYEYFQAFATGTFKETLTIAAPAGVANGSSGSMLLGWDVTGSSSNGAGGSAYLGIFASTSASLPGTSSNTLAVVSSGHYDLVSPISFVFGSPFELTVLSSVFSAVGYDYSSSTPPSEFVDMASADFLHTAVLSLATVNDAFGRPLIDATISTSSGRSLLPVVIPEPAVGTVIVLCGMALLGRRR